MYGQEKRKKMAKTLSPEQQALQAQIDALKAQLAQEKAKLAAVAASERKADNVSVNAEGNGIFRLAVDLSTDLHESKSGESVILATANFIPLSEDLVFSCLVYRKKSADVPALTGTYEANVGVGVGVRRVGKTLELALDTNQEPELVRSGKYERLSDTCGTQVLPRSPFRFQVSVYRKVK
jgi:hypothetical protein